MSKPKDMRAPYSKTVLTYTFNGVEHVTTQWHGLEFSKQLATIIIFRRHFGPKYNKSRCDAEDRLDNHGKVRFRNILIHSVKWETSGPYHLTQKEFFKKTRSK